MRSGDLVSYCAEEGVRILGEGKLLVSDSFPGNERTKYCLTSKVTSLLPFRSFLQISLSVSKGFVWYPDAAKTKGALCCIVLSGSC